MDSARTLRLNAQQREALTEAKRKITQRFAVEKIVIFGSAVRGELDPESDIDLLIVTHSPIDRRRRNEITDLIFEVNLKHGTNLSSVVIARDLWERGLVSALPFRRQVETEGVEL